MKEIKINSKENKIIIEINTNNYLKEVIYKTCYIFINRVFVFLNILKKNIVTVTLQGKEILNKKQIEGIKIEFINELRNIQLRENISKRNTKTVEYIVGGAITAAFLKDQKNEEDSNLEKEIENLTKELDKIEEDDFVNDPLEIRKIVKRQK